MGSWWSESVLCTENYRDQRFCSWKFSERVQGPDIPKVLFGQCVELLSNGSIMLYSGFGIGSLTYRSTYYEWKGDLFPGVWEAKPGTTLNTARYHNAWFSTGDAILVAVGWKSVYNINPHIAWEIGGWFMI